MSAKTKILFVDDEKAIRDLFQLIFKKEPFSIQTACDGVDALEKIESFAPEIVVADVNMPRMGGLTLLNEIMVRHPHLTVVMVTGYGAVKDAVDAMKAGAYDYILKPFDVNAIRELIKDIAARRRTTRKGVSGHNEAPNGGMMPNMVGLDPKMIEVFERVIDVAQSNATVLITGETGTGKELVADAIHQHSARASGPLVKVNCAALTETIINNELFGHERGAFTGAVGTKSGYFETADTGTIFLDEIGDIPVHTQISLLRVLEQGSFTRVGSTRPRKVDVRLICATHKNLPEAVARGIFREDLFYRINVVNIHLPPLRERKSDIVSMANFFLKKCCADQQRNIEAISHAALKTLIQYDWPGNVRELKNTIERAVVFCKGDEIVPTNLSEIPEESARSREVTIKAPTFTLADVEKSLISKVLAETDWNLKQAAEHLAIARGTLYGKMKRYHIERTE